MSQIIGITGGIASGKSTVTNYLREKGYQVVDADQLVHELQAPGGRLYEVLVAHYGSEILLEDGQLNRPLLGQKIFSDPLEQDWSRETQGQIIREELERARDHLAEQEAVFFMDIPLLIEQDYVDWFNQVWLVWVDRQTQLERFMARNAYSQAEAERRLQAQMPLDDKRAYADQIVYNSGSLGQTQIQLDQLLQELAEG